MQIPSGKSLPSGLERIGCPDRSSDVWRSGKRISEEDLRNGSDGELREQTDQPKEGFETDEEKDLQISEAKLFLRPKNHENDEYGFY